MKVEIEYPSAFKTPPKVVNNAEGETVEVILSYEDYQRLLELLEDAYDAALAESRKDEEYTPWEEFKVELDKMASEDKGQEMISIELFDLGEVHSLRSFVDEFVRSHPSLSFRDEYWMSFRDWISQVSVDSNSVIYTAKSASRIIGVAVGTIQENGPLLDPPRVGYIGFLVVSPEFRRRGVGSNLWRTLCDWFSAQGVNEIQLYTQIDNDVARGFWRECGFEVMFERRRRRID